MARKTRSHNLGNVAFIVILIVLILLLLLHPAVGDFIIGLGQSAGLLGLFVVGFFYAISTTGPPAAVAAFFLGRVYSPLILAGVGALGSVCADFLMFQVVKKDFSKSANYFEKKLSLRKKTKKLLRIIAWISAALFIILPLPDELGVAILGTMHIKLKKFFVISYFGNFLGLLLFSYLGSVL